MEQEIINKAKEMLTNADTGTNDCKHYNNGFMDGVEYTIKALRQPTVSGSLPQSQGEINSFMLVNALRLLDDENRDGLCASLFARSSDKEHLLNRLIELGGNDC